MAEVMVNGETFNATGTVKDGQVVALEPAKDYAALNAKDFLAAVESGELSKADALQLEEGRAEPRKSVLEVLKPSE